MQGILRKQTFQAYDPKPLIAARTARGLSQRQAAKELGLHFVTLCRIENAGNTEYETIEAICRFYEIPLESVLRQTVQKVSEGSKNLPEMLA